MNTPDPVPPEHRDDPGLHPPVFRQGDKLYAATSASLPDDICIKSGGPAKKHINKALRNPYNPLTWFGGQIREEVGLSKKHLEQYYMALALTYSLLVLGTVFIILGLISKSLGMAVFGLVGVLGCGIFRAAVPIWSPNTKVEPLEIRGVGKKYRELFPEWEGEIPSERR